VRQSISLFTLGVSDYARAKSFYEAIGWAVTREAEETAFFQANGVVLVLWSREKLAADMGIRDESAGWGGVALAHNVRSPAEVDRVLADAEAAGATIGRPGAATFWGGYSGVFIDPEGHAWEVAHNPHWTLRDDGSIELPE
jgi:predicted lactoylglutathione lyase